MRAQQAVTVGDPSQVGEARRVASELARLAGFDATDVGRVGIAVTEAATNLVRHAGGGQVLLRADGDALEMVAVDRGPGIADVAAALRDGYSTAGTPGTGLGAISRQADEFDVYTRAGRGTAVAAVFRPRGRAAPRGTFLVGGVAVPKPGEVENGDAWAAEARGARVLVCVADGLGHGPAAASAATRAVGVLRAHPDGAPADVVRRMHEALRPTRGAAVGVAAIDARRGVLRFAGIGNVGASVLGEGRPQNLVSHYGTLGHDMRRLQEFEYAWPRGGLLVMHSDGLGSRWDLADYPGLAERASTLIAAVLYRDFRRGNDDVTVVTVREAP